MPRFARPAATAAAVRGPMVDRSTTVFTRLPSITPPGPSATCSTICGVGRHRNSVSTWSATSLVEPSFEAPAAAAFAAAATLLSYTTTSCPALRRCPLIGPPMFPTPMKPSFCFAMPVSPVSSVLRLEPDRLHERGHARRILFQQRAERIRPPLGARRDLGGELLLHALLVLRAVDHLGNGGREALEHRARRTLRREEAVPDAQVE